LQGFDMAAPILDSLRLRQTISQLHERIEERFPNSGLLSICGQLQSIAEQAEQRCELINKPIWWIRAICWLLIGLIVVLICSVPFAISPDSTGLSGLTLRNWLELGDPILNEVVLTGAMLFFLSSMETRFKRHRALKAIHDLRSVAHVIDMHQLAKDPDYVVSTLYTPTDVSPKPTLSQSQLRRYLDYCSEMLALTSKVATLYVQKFDDPVALSAVNEVESLTTGLSRKIWQKIMILHGANQESTGEGRSVVVRPIVSQNAATSE